MPEAPAAMDLIRDLPNDVTLVILMSVRHFTPSLCNNSEMGRERPTTEHCKSLRRKSCIWYSPLEASLVLNRFANMVVRPTSADELRAARKTKQESEFGYRLIRLPELHQISGWNDILLLLKARAHSAGTKVTVVIEPTVLSRTAFSILKNQRQRNGFRSVVTDHDCQRIESVGLGILD
jgi:hypothetical protein